MAVPVRRYSWSISIHFIEIHSFVAKNRKKITKTPILGFKDNPKKLIGSACYVKQHVCAYLQPFSH